MALPYGAALVRNAHNATNARGLLNYLWSAEAQNLVGNAFASPARPDVHPADERSTQVRSALEGVRIIRPDWTAVAGSEKVLVDRWLSLRTAPDSTAPPVATAPPPTLAPPSATPPATH